jgi:hypothetical protein
LAPAPIKVVTVPSRPSSYTLDGIQTIVNYVSGEVWIVGPAVFSVLTGMVVDANATCSFSPTAPKKSVIFDRKPTGSKQLIVHRCPLSLQEGRQASRTAMEPT